MKREPRTRAQREPGILALQAEEEVNTSSQRGRGSAGPRGWPNRSYPRQDCQISRVPPLTLVSNLGSLSQWSVAMPALTMSAFLGFAPALWSSTEAGHRITLRHGSLCLPGMMLATIIQLLRIGSSRANTARATAIKTRRLQRRR